MAKCYPEAKHVNRTRTYAYNSKENSDYRYLYLYTLSATLPETHAASAARTTSAYPRLAVNTCPLDHVLCGSVLAQARQCTGVNFLRHCLGRRPPPSGHHLLFLQMHRVACPCLSQGGAGARLCAIQVSLWPSSDYHQPKCGHPALPSSTWY